MGRNGGYTTNVSGMDTFYILYDIEVEAYSFLQFHPQQNQQQVFPCALTESLGITGWADRVIARAKGIA